MKISAATLLATLTFAAFALTEMVNLHNGVNISTVTVGQPNLAPLPDRWPNYCSRSVLSTNDQHFRDQCRDAYYELENVKYTDGGRKGGVCSGKCGFFVAGKGCGATMEDMVNAYQEIRHNYNCLACGWIYKPGTWDKCKIKMDYVTGC